jgi:hypothetical protein
VPIHLHRERPIGVGIDTRDAADAQLVGEPLDGLASLRRLFPRRVKKDPLAADVVDREDRLARHEPKSPTYERQLSHARYAASTTRTFISGTAR